MTEITPDRYYVSFYFIELPDWVSPSNFGGNLLGCLHRPLNEPMNWQFDYRFRYIKDKKVFDSEDEKSAYVLRIANQSQEEVEKKIDQIMGAVADKAKTICDHFIINGDGKACMEKMLTCPPPWMHTQTVPLSG